MELAIGIVVFLAILVLVVWLATLNPWLPVSQTLVLPGVSAARLDQPVFLLLSNVAGSEVTQAGPGIFNLLLRRTPAWIWVPLVITFPIGLLFLLVKQAGSLQVVLTPTATGSEVRMVGKTKKSVVKTLAKAFGSLGGEVAGG